MPQSEFGTLIVIQPDGTNIRVALEVPFLRIGRSESCDVVIADAKVSRLHLEMTLTEGQAHFLNVSQSSKFISKRYVGTSFSRVKM